jgi:hypothetical protein
VQRPEQEQRRARRAGASTGPGSGPRAAKLRSQDARERISTFGSALLPDVVAR